MLLVSIHERHHTKYTIIVPTLIADIKFLVRTTITKSNYQFQILHNYKFEKLIPVDYVKRFNKSPVPHFRTPCQNFFRHLNIRYISFT